MAKKKSSSKKSAPKKPDPKKSAPKKPDPKKSAPKKPDPKKSAPKKPDPKKSDGKKYDGKKKDDGKKSGGKKDDGKKSGGKKDDGKKSGGKKGVKIEGIQGRVNLKDDILQPLRSGIESVKPDFTKKDWKSIKSLFTKAADGNKITEKELGKLRAGIADTSGKSGFTYNEGQLASGYVSNAINQQQYKRYNDKALDNFQSFRKYQEGSISNMMKSQKAAMASQLAQIQGGANGSLNNYRTTLNQSMAQSRQMLQGQRNTFAQGNAQSRQNIQKYQSQVRGLHTDQQVQQYLTDQISSRFNPVNGQDPFLNIGLTQGYQNIRPGAVGAEKFGSVKGMDRFQNIGQQQGYQDIRPGAVASEKFSPVQGMDAFGSIGVNRGPIRTKRDPTITGLSSAQKASSSRQQKGIQGFRTKQVA